MADEAGGEYSRLVALIDELEASSQKTGQASLDISTTFVPKDRGTKGVDYADALSMLEGIEGLIVPKEHIPKEEAPQHLVTSGLAQAQYTQVNVVQPGAPEQPPQRGGAQAMQKQKENLAKELGSIATKLSAVMPSMSELKRRKINISELVLPNLSTADQIAELERIIEGLKEHVFDKDHLSIVVDEVYGLQQVVDAARRKGAPAEQGLEKSLSDLRNQRLSEAISLLKTQGAAS